MTVIRKGDRYVAVMPEMEHVRNQLVMVGHTVRRYYFAVSDGTIQSMTRSRNAKRRILKQSREGRGRSPKVWLLGKTRTVKLVLAQAYFTSLDGIKTGKVGHLNGDKSDNRVSNLFVDVTPVRDKGAVTRK